MRASSILTTPSAIQQSIRAALSQSRIARIAVPFWGGDPEQLVGLSVDLAGRSQIICNLQSGMCDPRAIEQLLARGAQVRSLATLHAKVYLGDEIAVVGSANASARALGMSGPDESHVGWQEVCVEIMGSPELKDLSHWFTTQWQHSADLNDPVVGPLLLELARKIYQPGTLPRTSLVDELIRNPQTFKTENLFVALDWEPYSEGVETEVNEANAKSYGVAINAWEKWPGMPGGAEILSFYYEKGVRPPISYEGSYFTPKDPKKMMSAKTGAILVAETQRILGAYVLSAADRKTLAAAVGRMNTDRLARRLISKDACLHITEFAEIYLG